MLARGHRVDRRRAPRRRRRRAQRAALRWTAEAAGLPVLAGPEEATLLGNLLVQAMALGEIGSLAEAREVVRASFEPTVYEPSLAAEWHEARERFAELAGPRGTGGRRVSACSARCSGNPGAEGPLGRRAAAGLSVLDGLVYRSNLLGADRALANIGGGNTSAKETRVDHVGREVRVLWVKGSGTDLATITAGGFAGLRLDELLPLRERDEMDDAAMVEYLLRSALRPGPAAAVDRDAAARLHPGAARRPHASRRGDRADLDAGRPRSSPRRRSATRPSGSTTSGPGFDMSRRIALLLEEHPDRARRAAREARARHLGRQRRGELRGDDRVRRARRARDRHGGARPVRPGRPARSRSSGRGVRRPPVAVPPRAPRRAARPTPTGSCSRSTEAPRRSRSPRPRARPRSARSARPCPDHLINTKHKPLVVEFDPATRRRRGARGGVPRGVEEYAAWYRGYYERNLDDETRQFPIDPPGPRVVLVPGVGIVTTGSDAARARISRDLYHRAIAVAGRRRRARRLPLAERERGVRDRVLAARALQARAGAAARRARRARRGDHRRRERDRTRDRAPACRARRARRRRRPERRRRARRSPTSSSPRTAFAAARRGSRRRDRRSRRSSR